MDNNGTVLLAFMIMLLGIIFFAVGIRGRGQRFIVEVGKK